MSRTLLRALATTLSVTTLSFSVPSMDAAAAATQEAEAQSKPEQMEARLLTGIRQLTFEGRRAGEGYFNQDGTQLVFQSERDASNPFYQIYWMDLETGDTERISPGMGKTTCAWIHPDGQRVLYASTHLDPRSIDLQNEEIAMRESGQERRYAWDYDDHFDLFAYDRTSGENTRLSLTKGYDAEGSYSPDGEWVAFSSNRHVYLEPTTAEDLELFEIDKSLFLDIYLMRADGRDVKRLTTSRGYDGGPFFSPDGTRICWRRFAEDGLTAEIFTMNVDGTDQRQLTQINAMSWAPYFHPSQDYLIFTTNRHGFGNFELYVVDVRGEREPVRVTHTNGFDGLPVFSPKGDMLAWTTNRTVEKQSQIFMASWNHEAVVKMLRDSPPRSEAVTERPTPVVVDPSTFTNVTTEPAIRAADLRKHVYTLADPAMEGRMTGSEGEKKATAYVAGEFERLDLEPAGDDGWFQPFEKTVVRGRGQDGGIERTFNGRNVLGLLRATDVEAPIIVIGAHVDHLGMDGADSSRAPEEERDQLHAGADDNASGVAGLLEIAEYLVDLRNKGKLNGHHNIVFAAWSGEEVGLLGSTYFAESLHAELGKPDSLAGAVAACLNMDMIGRLDDVLILSGIGSSSIWRGEIERRNAPVGLPLSLVDDCTLPTDTNPFYNHGVPILSAFTGAHDDYHTPRDTADKLDYEDMQKVSRLMALVTRGLAMRVEVPDFIQHDDAAPRASRTGAKAYLGTIPDYAKAPIPGLRLSGCATGGPAHTAGVRGGDIVVSLNNVEVKDIYDYTDALDALKPGVEVEITIVRDGERKQFKLVPGSRE